ncbi:MAG: NAD(P)/FAD-dependent oxidoreductase [Alkalispirochaeta sp.]
MSRTYDVVVVGAGAAGLAAATSARQTDPSKSILLVNNEDRLPYQRTKISKHLAEGFGHDQFALHPDEWFQEHSIDRLDDVSVERIDLEAHRIELSGHDEPVEYRKLVLALGGEPLLPKVVRPHESGSFFVVRSARDGEELRSRAGRVKSVLIAGMGVLAVELAYQLRQMGKQVTLAGATPQLIPRQLNARAGEILEDVLAQNKVKMLFQEEILSFERIKKNWTVQMLKHSAHYDLVVFCIGVTPRTEIAKAAGLTVDRGIVVNEHLTTSDPDVFAAGDCAQHPDGGITYLWHSAEDQGHVAGTNAVGGEAVFDELPHRLKSTVFDQFLFSIRKPKEPWEHEVDEFENENQFYALYWNGSNQLHGAVMMNDESYAPTLESAVREGWTRDQVLRALELVDD